MRQPCADHDSMGLTVCVDALQKDEFLRLAINAIHNDLISRNEAFQSLALTFVSNSEWQDLVMFSAVPNMCLCSTLAHTSPLQHQRNWSMPAHDLPADSVPSLCVCSCSLGA